MKSTAMGAAAFEAWFEERRAEGLVTGPITLQADNAMLSSAFKRVCRRNGVRPQACAPHAHWQNGIAERGLRTVMESTRSMLIAAKLPNPYWAMAYVHATKLQNIIGRERDKFITPC